MEQARKEISEYGKLLIEKGLTEGTSGNLSIYDPQSRLMAISPSGIPYEEIRPEDVTVMDLQGNIIDGIRKPSSEHGLHSAVYRVRGDAAAVVHAHPVYCTTLACMGSPLEAVHYAIAEAGSVMMPLVRYETFGTPELAAAVEEKIGSSRGLLLANHGMLACGGSMKEAFGLTRTMEWCAQIQWRCMCAGGPRILSAEQMEKAVERYRNYGQQEAGAKSPRGYYA